MAVDDQAGAITNKISAISTTELFII